MTQKIYTPQQAKAALHQYVLSQKEELGQMIHDSNILV
jgi:hypothetical protein